MAPRALITQRTPMISGEQPGPCCAGGVASGGAYLVQGPRDAISPAYETCAQPQAGGAGQKARQARRSGVPGWEILWTMPALLPVWHPLPAVLLSALAMGIAIAPFHASARPTWWPCSKTLGASRRTLQWQLMRPLLFS